MCAARRAESQPRSSSTTSFKLLIKVKAKSSSGPEGEDLEKGQVDDRADRPRGPSPPGPSTTEIKQLPKGSKGSTVTSTRSAFNRVTAAVINSGNPGQGHHQERLDRRYKGDNTTYKYSLG